jgi:hypothetical protein
MIDPPCLPPELLLLWAGKFQMHRGRPLMVDGSTASSRIITDLPGWLIDPASSRLLKSGGTERAG